MGQLVPWGQVWRTGANQATHLKTNFDMKFGDAPVTKGTYTLWTVPSETSWTIVVNKQTGQWGTNYDEKQDLARFDVRPEQTPALVDTFTIALQATGSAGGVMKLMWEHTLVSVPFEKDLHIRPLSPSDSTAVTLKGHAISIRYSRPFMRGRNIWGVVVPFDSVWRTGANAATQLTTETGIDIGNAHVPKGSYTLYSVPTDEGLTLIISKKAGGPAQYDPRQDLARVRMQRQKFDSSVDPFRIWLESETSGGARLHLGWADRVYEAEIHAN